MSEPAIARPGDTPSRSREWFRQNALLIGIIGSVASIISIPLAIYFFARSTRARELVYLVNPARAVVFKPGQTSQLKVLLRDRPIRSDVTAVQVAFWNAGNEPIRPEDVLEPIVLRLLGPRAQLIEATLRKVSRPVVAPELVLIYPHASKSQTRGGSISQGAASGTSQGAPSGIRILWKILEKNDGGVIQLVFSGNPKAFVIAEGTLIGQRTISHPSAGARYDTAVALMGSLLMIIVGGVGVFFPRTNRYEMFTARLRWASLWIGAGMIIWMYAAWRVFTPVEPPFGF